jgi:hypothetical protein
VLNELVIFGLRFEANKCNQTTTKNFANYIFNFQVKEVLSDIHVAGPAAASAASFGGGEMKKLTPVDSNSYTLRVDALVKALDWCWAISRALPRSVAAADADEHQQQQQQQQQQHQESEGQQGSSPAGAINSSSILDNRISL